MTRRTSKRVRFRGYSLVELLTVVMVITISGAVVVPYILGADDSAALAGARMLASDLQYAQDSAIATQADVTVAFDVLNESYTLSNQSGALIHPITKNTYTTDFTADGNLAGLNIVSAFAGAGSVTFDPTGAPNRGGTIVLEAGDQTYHVTVSSVTGTVSIEAQQ